MAGSIKQVVKRKVRHRPLNVVFKVDAWDFHIGVSPRWKHTVRDVSYEESMTLEVCGGIIYPERIPTVFRNSARLHVIGKRGFAAQQFANAPESVGYFKSERTCIDASGWMDVDFFPAILSILNGPGPCFTTMKLDWPVHRSGDVMSFSFDRTFDPDNFAS